MNKDKLTILNKCLESGISNILLDNTFLIFFEDAVILNSDCDIRLLNGYYNGSEFISPDWYQELLKKDVPVLIIKDLNKISLKEQMKFTEILKYKKISTFDLPDNCIIISTTNELKKGEINQEIYSLMAHI